MTDSIFKDTAGAEFTNLSGSEWYTQLIRLAGGVRIFRLGLPQVIQPLAMKKNDLQPYYLFQLIDADGNAVDLSGSTIYCTMRNAATGAVKINHTVNVTLLDQVTYKGQAYYAWLAGDTDTVGKYYIEFEITPEQGGKFTVPPNNSAVIYITDALDTLREKVISSVRDDSGRFNAVDYDRNINAAISKYSTHRPAMKVADIAGNGTHDYALPTGWIDEFSTIKSIEYPLGDMPETLLGDDEYSIYQSPTEKKIRLFRDTPDVGESFRLTFTVLRTTTTIPQNDMDALCNLAAAFCLEELANMFAQTSDSTIAADAVNYQSKSGEFAARAKRLMQLYKEHLGLKAEDLTPPSSAVTDMQIDYPGGGDRLTHPRRGRKQR